MHSVTKAIEWNMGHRIPHHPGKCKSPHGHRYRLEATFAGPVDGEPGSPSQDMVMDFDLIKEVMRERVYKVLDHSFMIHEGDGVMMAMFQDAEKHGFLINRMPFVPTAEAIAEWCHRQLADTCPDGVRLVRCRVYETPQSWADYAP